MIKMHFRCEDCINAERIDEGKQKGIAIDIPFKIKIVKCKIKGNIKLNRGGKMNSCKDYHAKYDWELNMGDWQWRKKEV